MNIIFLFIIGFVLGLAFTLIGEKAPILLPEVEFHGEDNSWILNLFIAAINATLLIVSYYEYGFSYEFLMTLVIGALVIIIFVSDFKYMIILDTPLIVTGILTLIFKGYFFSFKTAGLSILSGLGLFILMLLIAILGKKIFKRDALGGGDIKLSLVMGIILGFRLGLVAIILSSLLALPYALGTILLEKEKEVPYGPFLVGSMAIVFIFMEKFVDLLNFLV